MVREGRRSCSGRVPTGESRRRERRTTGSAPPAPPPDVRSKVMPRARALLAEARQLSNAYARSASVEKSNWYDQSAHPDLGRSHLRPRPASGRYTRTAKDSGKVVNRAVVIFTLICAVAPVRASSQPAPVRHSCGAEIEQHCAGVQPGEGRIGACVGEHFAAFSEPCKKALLSGVTVVKACKADVQRSCRGVQPEEGRIQACMKDHFTEYSEPCKRAIIIANFGRR